MTENTSTPTRMYKVSVIVRTMNRPRLLGEALASICNQDFKSLEIIVVNDGGEDISQVTDAIDNKPFCLKLINLENNRGRSAAANAGLRAASGEYLIFLDDDDYFLPNQIATLAKALDENPEYGVAYSDVEAVDEEGNILYTYDQDFDEVLFLAASYLPIHGVMFRHLYVEQGHLFDERLDVYEDWDFWARISEKTRFLHVSGVGAIYRDIGASRVGNVNSEKDAIKSNRLKLYELWLSDWDAGRLLTIFDGMLSIVAKYAEKIHKLNQDCLELNQAHSELNEHLLVQQKHIEAQNKIINDTNNAIKDAYGVCDQINRRYIHASEEIKNIKNELLLERSEKNRNIVNYNQHIEDYENKLAALYQSTSWRITAPLRTVAAAAYRLKNTSSREIEAEVEVVEDTVLNESEKPATECWPLVLYERWLKNANQLDGLPPNIVAKCQEKLKKRPLISIVMPVYNPNLGYLREAIESVVNQSYQNWEFCIADDCSTDPNVQQVLEEAATSEKRIKLILRSENGHISKASNTALEMATGDYIALLDHDDRLDSDALLLVALEINNHPDVNIIYSDEDKISEEEGHCQPYYKGDFNYDLFLSHNMISHLGVYRHELLKQIGGFRIGFEGSQDYDLALRCLERSEIEQVRHIPTVLYHWRSYEGSTALLHTEKSYALKAAGKAIREHLNRTGQNEAELIELSDQGAHRVRYPIPQDKPLVSIVVVVDTDQLMLQQHLLKLIDINSYQNVEIIIACHDKDAGMVQFVMGGFLGSRYPVRTVSASGGWPTIINTAVDSAKGELVAVLTSSIEVVDENWLSEMVSHALRPQVGVVGARILHTDNSVQHAGLILRPDAFPGFPMQGPQGDHPGYFGRALLQQNYNAISPVCMVFRYKHYEDLGGMDDSAYSTPLAALDFYLKLREKSYWHTWTPFAQVRLHKQGDYPFDDCDEAQNADLKTLRSSWHSWFKADPAYNPNLSLSNLYTAFAEKPRSIEC
jgi:glycosyltransferase involved in cell wall biosynthesis